MKNPFSPMKRFFLSATFGLALAASQAAHAQDTGWNKTSGTNDYDTTTNWVGDTINGIWDSTLTLGATQVVTFDSDLSLGTGLSFGHAGNFLLTLRGDGTNRTITLGGNITVATTGGTTANVTLGSSTAGQNLNIDLGGVTRTMSVAASRTLTLINVVSNGTIDKTGSGTLTLSGANTFAGGLTLSGGTLMLANNAAFGMGTVTINGGTTLSASASRSTTNNNVQNWNGDFTLGGANSLNLGTGAVTMSGNRIVTVSNTLTVGGAIGDSGSGFSLTKAGAGTLVLNGANTYSGGTVIDGGILTFGAGAVPSTGDITINSAGILNANGSLANVTAWLGKITTDSSGVLALTGNSSDTIDFSSHADLFLGATTASTYSGTLTPGGTTYRLGGGTAALTVSSALTGGNSLVVGPTGSAGTNVILTAANTHTGATTINSGTLTLAGATGSAASSAITADAATTLAFDSSTAGVTGATRAPSVNLNSARLNALGNSGSNSVETITGALTVNARLSAGLLGTNIVTLTPNAATNTRLTAGSLVRAGNGTVFFRGTNLGVNTIASNTAGASNIEFTTAPTAQLVGGGGAAGTTNISIIPWATGDTSATGNGSGFVTYDANGIRPLAAGEYATSITPDTITTDNVKLTLPTGTTTVDGAATINSLALFRTAAAITTFTGTGALTVTSGAVLVDHLGATAFTISKPLDFGTAQGVIMTNTVTGYTHGVNISGGISGSGGLVISSVSVGVGGGTGITGATTYTGDTYINGELRAGHSDALPNDIGARTGDVYLYGHLDLSVSTGVTVAINGLNGSGSIEAYGSAASGRILSVGGNNANGTFSGTFMDPVKGSKLYKVGTGTQVLSGTASNYTGLTYIQNGILDVVTLNSVSGGVATSSLGAPVTVASGNIHLGSTTTTGTLKVSGTGETTDRVINLNGTTGGGGIEQAGTGLLKFTSDFTAIGAGSKMLTLQGSTAGTGEISGAIVDYSGTHKTSLTKAGTGTWTLSGANTYTGETTINQGTLRVAAGGSIASSSLTTVNSGGTLAGSGTVGAVSVLGTGIVAPGSSAGTLSVSGSFTLASTASLNFELKSGDVTIGNNVNDLISVTGDLTLDGTLNITQVDGSLADFTTYRLFNYTGSLTNNTLDISSAFLLLHPGSSINTATAGEVNLMVVPEPGTLVMLLGGLGMLVGFQRSRRRRS